MVTRLTSESRLADLASPGSVRGFKATAIMPFVQMENIELFIRACRSQFSLREHDLFVTANLFEDKDMLQVIRCLSAFSRWAHERAPAHFPSEIGGRTRGTLSPDGTGTPTFGSRTRGVSNASNTSSAYNAGPRPPSVMMASRTGDSNGRKSPVKAGSPGPLSPGGVSSWSKKSDELGTAPAWNIAQYGYMGGASQGNLGVAFGGRRQITSAGPHVPSMAEKEKKRREKEGEEERIRLQAEEDAMREREAANRRKREQAAEEERRAQEDERRRWAEEARKIEQYRQEQEKKKWAEEERRWQKEEEQRQKEEREAEARLSQDRSRSRARSDARLQGQFLSQYQAEQGIKMGDSANDSADSIRVKELERQLEEARERERRYEQERQSRRPTTKQDHHNTEEHDLSLRLKDESSRTRARSRSRPRAPSRKNSDEEWRADERDYLRKQWASHHQTGDTHEVPPPKPPRPLPEPAAPALPVRVKTNTTGPSSRPLPDPAAYASSNPPPSSQNRTDRFLASNPAPQQAQARTTYSSEIGGFDSSAERDAEDRRRAASQNKTKAGGWASKSLLEREMELERQRQQEWEESQKEVKTKKSMGEGVDGIGGGLGGKWDVNQWTGYTGGDGGNRGNLGVGGGRRQIVGPRPPPGR